MNPKNQLHPDREHLAAFNSGRLNEAEAVEVESHLQEECPACSQVLEALPEDTLVALLRTGDTFLDDAASAAASGALPNCQSWSLPKEIPGRTRLELPSSAPLAIPADLLGHPRYDVLELLGAGGMGAVYKAEHRVMHRLVALKTITPALTEQPAAVVRFNREIMAAARLSHPNIVTAFDAEQAGSTHFLVMEYVEGTTLAHRLAEEGKLPVALACTYLRQAALGLQHAHERGMVHRDIKPHNLMLTPQGVVKILDFGLARFMRESPGSGARTELGTVMGTPDYMAPEQGLDTRQADIRADIYSLGCTLFVLLTGQPPFAGATPLEKILKHQQAEALAVTDLRPEVPSGLAAVLRKMLAKRPEDRYQTPAEVAEALAPWVNDEKTSMPTTAPLTGAEKIRVPVPSAVAALGDKRAGRRPSRRLLVAAGFILLLVVGGAGTWALMQMGVIRISNDLGDFVINTDDPDFAFSVSKGVVILHDKKTDRTFNIKLVGGNKAAGEYELDVTDISAGLSFKTKTFTIKRGEDFALKATFEPKQVAAVKGTPLDDAWLKQVAALPADKQVKAVADKLQERNPGFDGKVTHKIEAGVVTELGLVVVDVSDIAPVRALTGLKKFSCGTDAQVAGKLADLSPLRGMKLTYLTCYGTPVSDLSPLKDMKLTTLICDYSQVADLSPLKGMPLTSLYCAATKVSDLSPLKDMKLTTLYCWQTKVSDLSPLKGMPLTILDCSHSLVADLTPLKDMKLGVLNCRYTRVADLSPLKSMKITNLSCDGTQVADLTPLKDMPLKVLGCDFKRDRDAAILRSIKTLETINSKPAAAFWKEVATGALVAAADPDRRATEWVLSIGGSITIKENGKERYIKALAELPKERFMLTAVQLGSNQQVSDAGLANFKDCKNLTVLTLNSTRVSDAALANFKDSKNLTSLNLGGTKVSDAGLAHLKDCKNLTGLGLSGTQVSDAGLAHLKDCKNLTGLNLNATQVSDAGLEHLKHLQAVTDILLTKTKVTAEGVKKLAAALPKCKIEWDGGVIEPQPSPLPPKGTWEIQKSGVTDNRYAVHLVNVEIPSPPSMVKHTAWHTVAQMLAVKVNFISMHSPQTWSTW